MIFMEFDLSGAEWVVVAYISGDRNMISVVESGKSPHVVTGSLITRVPEELVEREHKIVGSQTDPDKVSDLRLQIPEILEGDYFLPRSMSCRQAGKKSNHGLNYNMRYRRFALENEIPEPEAMAIVEAYSGLAYPGIKDFWKYVENCLKKDDRTLVNLMGRRVRLLDEWGTQLLDKAYSFIPQSTVNDIINTGISKVYDDYSKVCYPAEIMAQTHDSATYQYPEGKHTEADVLRIADFAMQVKEYMSPKLIFGDRDFTLGIDLKIGRNLGDMHQIGLESLAQVITRIHLFFETETSAGGSPAAVGDPVESAVEEPAW